MEIYFGTFDRVTSLYPSMNTPVSLLSASSLVRARHGVRLAGAATLLCGASSLMAQTWQNADLTVPPGPSQDWSVGGNWSGGLAPAANGTVSAFRVGNLAASIAVGGATNSVGAVSVNYGTQLVVGSTGELINGLSGRLDIGANAASTVTVASGGKITLLDGTLGGSVRLQLQNGSTLQTAGAINHNYVAALGGSTVNMTGGSITTRQTFNGVQVADSTFNQSGGTVTTSNIQIARGTYTVSGGTITTSGAGGLYFAGSSLTAGSKFTVQGSAATLNFSSYRNDDRDAGEVRPTFAFRLDNSAGHISTINLAANTSQGGDLRATANLEVSLAGGVLLSGVASHAIIQRQAGAFDSAWNNESSLTGLWVDATDETNTTTKAQVRIGLNSAHLKGAFDAEAATPLSFGAASLGYVTLANVDTGSPLQLGLKVSGGTLSNFTGALTSVGVTWAVGFGGYDVVLILDPSVSGAGYFAWDLAAVDGAMGVTGIGLASPIPEPSAFAVVAGLAGLGLAGARRRQRARR